MSRPSLRPLALAAALVAPLALAAGIGAQEGAPVPEDESLLRQAEECVRRGRYAEALRTYQKLAKSYPDGEAGIAAARRSQPSAYLGTVTIVDHGPSMNRIDVALMGDGYELEHQKAFLKLAEDVPPLFERQDTFREYYGYFDFQCVHLVSAENGVDGFGRDYDTALGAYTIGTIAGHVGIDGKLVREVFDQMPANDELAIVFVKNGVLGTGGGGIATIGGRSAATTIHEFGHAFAGLGDEYSTKTHDRGEARESANVATTEDPKQVPWAHFIEADYPGVGVFEGAAGQVHGAWKPTTGGCVMENGEAFCPPCREEIVLRIYSVVDPVDGCSPDPQEMRSKDSIALDAPRSFEVRAMRPATHELEVRWWLLPEKDAPPAPRSSTRRYARGGSGRLARGPLAGIAAEPRAVTKPDRDGLHRLTLDPKELEPGRYRLVCRVRDGARPKGARFPWVLRDESGLLESERAWWVVVPPAGGAR